jgi:cytochrome c-type biogenesis protein CcmH/NrfG
VSDDSHDSQRSLEQKALRNTRALLDKLEGEEAVKRQGWKPALALAFVLVAVAIGAIFAMGKLHAPELKTPEQARCEAEAIRAGTDRIVVEAQKWKKDPALSPEDIKVKYRDAQLRVRAAAAKECSGGK